MLKKTTLQLNRIHTNINTIPLQLLDLLLCLYRAMLDCILDNSEDSWVAVV